MKEQSYPRKSFHGLYLAKALPLPVQVQHTGPLLLSGVSLQRSSNLGCLFLGRWFRRHESDEKELQHRFQRNILHNTDSQNLHLPLEKHRLCRLPYIKLPISNHSHAFKTTKKGGCPKTIASQVSENDRFILYVCMYVCMYVVCMYVCLYVRTYVCIYVCMYVCMYVYMYVCVYVCMYSVCMYVCTYSMNRSFSDTCEAIVFGHPSFWLF